MRSLSEAQTCMLNVLLESKYKKALSNMEKINNDKCNVIMLPVDRIPLAIVKEIKSLTKNTTDRYTNPEDCMKYTQQEMEAEIDRLLVGSHIAIPFMDAKEVYIFEKEEADKTGKTLFPDPAILELVTSVSFHIFAFFLMNGVILTTDIEH